MGADIDLDNGAWTPIGTNSTPFKGTFDGNNHTISNLTVTSSGSYVGLFGYIGGNAESGKLPGVKNLTVNNATVKSPNGNAVGGVVGNAFVAKVTNVHVTGTVDIEGSKWVGGVVGYGYVKIDGCSLEADGNIKGNVWCVGGILGYGGEGTTSVDNCSVEGTENGLEIYSTYCALGGVVGQTAVNGTQHVSGSNLTVKNVTMDSDIEWENTNPGYFFGGSNSHELTGVLAAENVTVEVAGKPAVIHDVVASVDGNCYTTLQAAITAADEDDTVTLLKDTAENVTIANGQSITLNLGGCELKNGNSAITVQNMGTLTVKDSSAEQTGKIVSNGADDAIDNYGTLNVESGTIQGGTAWYGIYAGADSVTNVYGTAKVEGEYWGIAAGNGSATAKINVYGNAEVSSRNPAGTNGGISASNATTHVYGDAHVYGACGINTNGSLTISDNAKVEAMHESAGTAIGVYVGANVVVEGGEIKGGAYGISSNGINTDNDGTIVTVNGGTISGTDAGIYQPQNGTLTISGGEIIGEVGVQLCDGSLVVSGTNTKITGSGEDERATKTGDGAIIDGAAISLVNRSGYGIPTAEISGGMFTSTHYNAVVAYTWSNNTNGEWADAGKFITGGTFTNNVETDGYVAEHYTARDNNDGTWTVIPDTTYWKARIEETGALYTTLQDAINAATSGQTVTLLTDVEAQLPNHSNYAYEPVFTIEKSIVLDGGGHKITVDEDNWSKYNNSITGHIFNVGVQDGHANTAESLAVDATIMNLTIEGNPELMRNGINAYTIRTGEYAADASTTLNLQNVNISGCGAVSVEANNSTVNIEDCNLENGGWNRAIDVDKGSAELNVTNGEIGNVYFGAHESSVKQTANISGGTFGGIYVASSNSVNRDIAISGGTFTTKLEPDWCAEGYLPISNGDGTYGVTNENLTLTANTNPLNGGGTAIFTVTGVEGLTADIVVSDPSLTYTFVKGDTDRTWTVTLPNATAEYVFNVGIVRGDGIHNVNSGTIVTRYNAPYVPSTPSTPDEPDEPIVDIEDDPTALGDRPFIFEDVHENDWFYDEVKNIFEHGLINGTTTTTYEPQTELTRGMIVTILWRIAGEPTVETASTFTDVPENAYYFDAINWGAANNIARGYDEETFAPDRLVSREELAALIYRYAELAELDLTGIDDEAFAEFDDAESVLPWFVENMKWAISAGIVKGDNGMLLPQDCATRAEAAAMVNRFIQIPEIAAIMQTNAETETTTDAE